MKKLVGISIFCFLFIGCSGGGHHGYSYSHAELAQRFVSALNTTGYYDVSLTKTYTYHAGYIVIYDYDLNEYDAIYVNDFIPGYDDPSYYLSHYGDAYYDLIPVGFNDYYDPYSGLTFEKVNATSKDLEKFAALAEQKVINMRAKHVATEFGLSMERSKDIVSLAMAWQKAGGKDLPEQAQDSYAKEILGFTITSAKNAVNERNAGNTKPLDDLIGKAAEKNDQTPEMINQIISKYFSN